MREDVSIGTYKVMRYCVGELPGPEAVLDVAALDVVGVGLMVVMVVVAADVTDAAVVVPVAATHWSEMSKSA